MAHETQTLFGKPRVLVQPRDGMAPVRELIDAARVRIVVKMFTFTAASLLDGLIAAQHRGVDVRVMLNAARSSGSRANDDAAERLRAGGVAVSWTSPRFAVTHEKSMVVDGRVALIATFNFGDKYFMTTRDYGLILQDSAAVREIEAGFESDWHGRKLETPDDSCLLWSNTNAREGMANLIASARHSVSVQHPKFSDLVIVDRLVAARESGVRVHILCGGAHGISPSDMLDTFSALRMLARTGVRVRKQKRLRLHAKLLIVDGERALVGSMNIDRSAFDLRRELGAVVADADAVAALKHQFDQDWDEAHPYEAPDPLTLYRTHIEPDEPPDPELDHE